MITIPIEIGDVILTGRFKNKKVVVKTIATDQYGLPVINGHGILKIRVEKLMNKGKEMSKESKVSNKKIMKEQSEEKVFEVGRTVPIKIKKEGSEYVIYRINQPDGSEVRSLNRGFSTKDEAERAAKLRGFTLVDDKGNIQEYEMDKAPEAMGNRSADMKKTKEQKIEWVTGIIRKVIRESKVSKKKLNEATDTDKIDQAIDELAALEKQLAEAKEKVAALEKELNVSAMEKRYKQIVDQELWDFLEQMKKDDERIARTKNVLLTIKRFQTEKVTYEYEKVLDFAMTQVNQDVKEKILMELKATEKISKVKPSLSFSTAENKLREDNVFSKIFGWIKSFFSSLNAKLKSKGQKIDSNLGKLEKSLKIQGQ
jgi:hypothetical protein